MSGVRQFLFALICSVLFAVPGSFAMTLNDAMKKTPADYANDQALKRNRELANQNRANQQQQQNNPTYPNTKNLNPPRSTGEKTTPSIGARPDSMSMIGPEAPIPAPEITRSAHSVLSAKAKYVKCGERAYADVCPTKNDEKPKQINAREFGLQCAGRYSLSGRLYCD